MYAMKCLSMYNCANQVPTSEIPVLLPERRLQQVKVCLVMPRAGDIPAGPSPSCSTSAKQRDFEGCRAVAICAAAFSTRGQRP